MKATVLAALLLAVFAHCAWADEALCPELVCKMVLEDNPGLSVCSFVMDSSGSSHYRLEFDKELMGRAFSPHADPKLMEIVGRVLAAPLVIMATDTDHPFAAVRIVKIDGNYAELTRQQYRACVVAHGEPTKLLGPAQDQARTELLTCIFQHLLALDH